MIRSTSQNGVICRIISSSAKPVDVIEIYIMNFLNLASCRLFNFKTSQSGTCKMYNGTMYDFEIKIYYKNPIFLSIYSQFFLHIATSLKHNLRFLLFRRYLFFMSSFSSIFKYFLSRKQFRAIVQDLIFDYCINFDNMAQRTIFQIFFQSNIDFLLNNQINLTAMFCKINSCIFE